MGGQEVFLSEFQFLDGVSEWRKGESLTARFRLTGKEEFLKDHFEGFPVMPGVLMLESLKQAASLLLSASGEFDRPIWRLVAVHDARFGQFVKPGNHLKVTVRKARTNGQAEVVDGRLDLLADDGSPRARALLAQIELVPASSTPTDRDRARAAFARYGVSSS